MATKQVELPAVGTVTLYKRKGNRSIRLSIGHNGQVRVSLPPWVPYRAGLQFVRTKAQWIVDKQQEARVMLADGQPIGKAHHLSLQASATAARVSSRLQSGQLTVNFPAALSPQSPAVQQAACKAAVRALAQEAKQLLPQRLAALAREHGFTYTDVHLRQLKSRWGSCNAEGSITLNVFLMQLPWPLIDYVLLHELVHTKILRHGPDFWQVLEQHMPDAKRLRKDIHAYHPVF